MSNRLRVILILVAGIAGIAVSGGLGLLLSKSVFAPHSDFAPKVAGEEPTLRPLPNPGAPAAGKRK